MKPIEQFSRYTPVADLARDYLVTQRGSRLIGNEPYSSNPHMEFFSERFFMMRFFEDYSRKNGSTRDTPHATARKFVDSFYVWKKDTVAYLRKRGDQDSRDLSDQIREISYGNLRTYSENRLQVLREMSEELSPKAKKEYREMGKRIEKWENLVLLIDSAIEFDRYQ